MTRTSINRSSGTTAGLTSAHVQLASPLTAASITRVDKTVSERLLYLQTYLIHELVRGKLTKLAPDRFGLCPLFWLLFLLSFFLLVFLFPFWIFALLSLSHRTAKQLYVLGFDLPKTLCPFKKLLRPVRTCYPCTWGRKCLLITCYDLIFEALILPNW